ncbi:hypothetical protein CEE44_00290 [Candidatus Woesearchaeota archaeon B3_Woes]|nr:MAG: hypothetical protein CEE44_00290 [Candidatus Woesearchaeota archaeon B3_Woes]
MSQEIESKDIIVTYDTLFEILRNEKTKEDLQKLHDTFFHDATNYLNEKQNILNDNKDQKGLFESDEKEKTLHQIGNIKKILTDIYERREKKIINMAVNKSRYSSNIIDNSALLDEEKLFYEMIISLLDSQRDKILDKLLKGQHFTKPEQTETKEEFKPADEIPKEESTKLVRFLTAVPQFMGEDMLEYGPYEEEDVSKLPIEIADVLIKKERAEEIKEN